MMPEGSSIPLPIRDSVIVSSYEADSILTAIETWADTRNELA